MPPTATVGGLLMAVVMQGNGADCLYRDDTAFSAVAPGRAACLLTVRAPLVDEINRMGSK